jgi:hypothetical protein
MGTAASASVSGSVSITITDAMKKIIDGVE